MNGVWVLELVINYMEGGLQNGKIAGPKPSVPPPPPPRSAYLKLFHHPLFKCPPIL